MVANVEYLAFNNSLEAGIRLLTLLVEGYPLGFDIQRLLYFDYLLVHSGDIPQAPPSLHPAVPERFGELLIRRGIIEKGLLALLNRGLIQKEFLKTGITYKANDEAGSFLDAIAANYLQGLRNRAVWILSNFSNFTDRELEDYFKMNLDQAASEFEQDIDLNEAYQL